MKVLIAGEFQLVIVQQDMGNQHPAFSSKFGVPPAISSLSLSLTTITLAISMLATSSLSESISRNAIFTAFTHLFAVLLLAKGLAILAGKDHWPRGEK